MASKAEAKALLARGQTLAAGRAFEQAGYAKLALGAFTQGGHWADAGRLLQAAGQYEDAGQALARAGEYAGAAQAWESAAGLLESRGGPQAAQRKAWRWASHCHAKAGDPRRAARLLAKHDDELKAAEVLESAGLHVDASRQFLTLGMREQAIDALMRAEQPQEAARLCEEIEEFKLAGRLYRQAGDWDQAVRAFERAHQWQQAAETAREIPDWSKVGEMYARAGEHLLSAQAYLEARKPDDAIKSLCYIKSRDPWYAEAVPVAVDALEIKGDMSFNAERFLHPFLAAPLTDPGMELVYRLAGVYEGGEFWETAEEHYDALLQRDAGYRDCAQRKKRMALLQKDSAAVYKHVLKEDFGYQETTERLDHKRQAPSQQLEGDLDEFPELPGAKSERTTDGRPTVSGTDLLATTPDDAGETRTGAPQASIMQLQSGARLGERYELIDRIGSGGRGAVFRARDLELDEVVAIKVIHPTDVTEDSLAWFRQEIKLARKLTHPNVIRLYDINEVGGLRFITMEYLEGEDLDELIARAGNAVPFHLGIRYMKQTASALAAAHQIGIIHRDIKPPNLFVVDGDTIKVLDFGIAKLMDVKGLSRTGLAYGTPQYMSPEQIRGAGDLDTRTDLYSLGCVMFNLFTGELVFDADETFALMLSHVNQPPPRPREFRPDIPSDLEAVILRLLEKDPADRYQTCEGLLRALEALE